MKILKLTESLRFVNSINENFKINWKFKICKFN